jgi:hypothetical protein
MFKVMLALHLLTAIFAIGPLAHAATTAARGIRHTDAAATASAARTLRVYSLASVLVVVFGLGVMPTKENGERVATFGEAWIWLSLLLWLGVVALALGVLAPALRLATEQIAAHQPVDSLRGRVAVAGGGVGVIVAVIVALMVYRPGS